MTPARELIRRGLLVFPPPGTQFPGRNGRKKAYVVDTRGAGADPVLRRWIVEALLGELHAGPPFDVVGGISKSGTAWAAWAAWAEDLPFANILLDAPRASGLQRQVEGKIAGRRVVLVDNWIRSGASIRRAAEVVADAGGEAVAAVAIVSSGPVQLGLPVRAAWDIGELLRAAGRRNGGSAAVSLSEPVGEERR